jgi:predicted DCC family thiol-disulfide oxidoreductase YuxK
MQNLSIPMKTLFVFYDGECGLCGKARNRLAGMAQQVPLVFIPYQDPEVGRLFPALARLDPDGQIVAMSDTGEIYQGDGAWITILWALRDYRSWALRLARPAWRRHAKSAVHYVSMNRLRWSGRLGLRPVP